MVPSKRQSFLLLSTASALLTALLTFTAYPLKALSTQTSPTTEGVQQMNIFQAIVLGFVQGITEFLPVSSTAHLKVIPVLLGWGDPGVAFTAVIQLGSIVAVLWYLWGDLRRLLKGVFRAVKLKDYEDFDLRLSLGILLGTIPIVFFGLLIKIFIPNFDKSPMRYLSSIGIASIVMSILLAVAETTGSRQRGYEKLTMIDGVLVGFAQSMALVPGVSRSGASLTTGLFLGLERETAAKFSFLLSIPAITLAGLVELKDALISGIAGEQIISLAVGTISAAIFSYLAITALLRFLRTQSTLVFIIYRLIFGVAILAAIAGGLLKNI
jgi:undecaprenyl-diphosphatase